MRTETATGANQLRYLVQVPFFPLHKLSNSMTISTRNSPFMPVPASKKYTKKDILILHCLIKANMTPPQVMTLSGVPHSTLLFPLKTARQNSMMIQILQQQMNTIFKNSRTCRLVLLPPPPLRPTRNFLEIRILLLPTVPKSHAIGDKKGWQSLPERMLLQKP